LKPRKVLTKTISQPTKQIQHNKSTLLKTFKGLEQDYFIFSVFLLGGSFILYIRIRFGIVLPSLQLCTSNVVFNTLVSFRIPDERKECRLGLGNESQMLES